MFVPYTPPTFSIAFSRNHSRSGFLIVVGIKRLKGHSMKQTVGDFIISRLHAEDVRRMFGYPGDGINGVFGALNRASDNIEFVQARHEEMAAFMASAYAKFSGELGGCVLRPPGQLPRISSLVCTMRELTINRSWRSSDNGEGRNQRALSARG